MAPKQIGRVGGTDEQPAVFFSGPEEFRAWLEANHDSATELWMGLYKKHVDYDGLTWKDAVPEALACQPTGHPQAASRSSASR